MEFYRFSIKIIHPEATGEPLAFRIMKLAYECQVRGECRYKSPTTLEIMAEGEKENLGLFSENIRKSMPLACIEVGTALKSEKPEYREFDITP